MNIKYLYGKKSYLNPFITKGESLWFRDLYSLGKIENQIICDDESIRKYKVNSKHIKRITLNGRDFKLAENSNFIINQPTRRCHILCLSKDGNKPELFQRFKADLCIGLNESSLITKAAEG